MCCAVADDADKEEAAEHRDLRRTRQDVYAVNGYCADDGCACVDVLYEDIRHLK